MLPCHLTTFIDNANKSSQSLFHFQLVSLFITLLTFTAVIVRADDNDEIPYEPADGICSKCNCTSLNGTLEDGESGNVFSLDCSMKDFPHLFAKWPEEMGDNHTSNLIRCA